MLYKTLVSIDRGYERFDDIPVWVEYEYNWREEGIDIIQILTANDEDVTDIVTALDTLIDEIYNKYSGV